MYQENKQKYKEEEEKIEEKTTKLLKMKLTGWHGIAVMALLAAMRLMLYIHYVRREQCHVEFNF